MLSTADIDRLRDELLAAGYTIGKRALGAGMSELILSPPNNAAERPFLRQIYIPHNDADEAEARAFAGRLEFVGPSDRRCKR